MCILKPVILLFVLAALTISDVSAQSSTNTQSQKVMEFGDSNADSEMAYLDVLAEALSKNPDSHGYIVAYGAPRRPPGDLAMRIYGYRDYLVNKRGIDSSRIVITAGGVKAKLSTELWLVPTGAVAPKADSEFQLVPNLPLKFDVVYPDCPPEMTVSLYELEDSLKFYAEALQANQTGLAKIVVYSGQRTAPRKIGRMATAARALLIRNHNIQADRIRIATRVSLRACSEVELWLIPKW